MSIKVGDLYEICSDDFWTSGKSSNKIIDGRNTTLKTNLKNGEIIEIRYPFEWHFRTVDSKYFHASPEEINKKCKPFGKIKEDTRFKNKMSLKEILEYKLYDESVQGVIID